MLGRAALWRAAEPGDCHVLPRVILSSLRAWGAPFAGGSFSMRVSVGGAAAASEAAVAVAVLVYSLTLPLNTPAGSDWESLAVSGG